MLLFLLSAAEFPPPSSHIQNKGFFISGAPGIPEDMMRRYLNNLDRITPTIAPTMFGRFDETKLPDALLNKNPTPELRFDGSGCISLRPLYNKVYTQIVAPLSPSLGVVPVGREATERVRPNKLSFMGPNTRISYHFVPPAINFGPSEVLNK